MARPVFHKTSGRVTELRAVDEGAVPASAPVTSRLFVLPVAARQWVSTDNSSTVAGAAAGTSTAGSHSVGTLLVMAEQ